jgi:hypothetical protein
MSARVFNPVVMSEMQRMLRGAGTVPEIGVQSPAEPPRRPPDGAAISRVCRNLFGPVDHEDTRRFVELEVTAQQARDAERWGFDFVAERELDIGPGTKRYLWEKVKPQDKVPQPYALRGMEYLNKCAIHGEVVAATSSPATTGSKQTIISGKQPSVLYVIRQLCASVDEWHLQEEGGGGGRQL